MAEHRKINRRTFLVIAGAAVVTASAGGLYAKSTQKPAPTGSDYYVARKPQILSGMDRTFTYLREALAGRYDPAFADVVIPAARLQFEELIPGLPYIGGDANQLTSNLAQSAGALAFYRVMKARGKTVQEIGEVLYEGFSAQMSATPKAVSLIYDALGHTPILGNWSRTDADKSQQRLYAEDWVFDYIEGDGEAFDWGVNYTECGVCKYYRAQGAEELTPYLCRLDYPMSRAYRMGLQRTTTLAGGGSCCDFRYKTGRATQDAEA